MSLQIVIFATFSSKIDFLKIRFFLFGCGGDDDNGGGNSDYKLVEEKLKFHNFRFLSEIKKFERKS